MSNSNGLVSSKDVASTGAFNSNFFLRVGEPIAVPSPLQIISPDGTDVATLSESNTGNLFIESGVGDMILYPGTGLLKLLSPNALEETAISTANNGDSAIDTSAGLFVNLGTDNDLFVNTAPTGAGDTHGIIISRNGLVPASVKVEDSGQILLSSTPGSIAVNSTQGTATYTAILSADPFTGIVSLANGSAGADGDINLQCSTASSSDVGVFVRPFPAIDAGIRITNVNTGPATGNVLVCTDGALELSSGTNIVRIKGDNGLEITPVNATGAAELRLINGAGSAIPTYYEMYCAGVTGGGLTISNFQMFGYSASLIRQIINATPDGASIAFGDGAIAGGCVAGIQGTSGFGRFYDTVYELPPISKALSGLNLQALSYPAGSSAVTGPTTALGSIIAGKSYLVSGQGIATRVNYASGGAGNYVVPGPFSVRLQMRWIGPAPPLNNTTVICNVPTGTYLYPANPLANEGTFFYFGGSTGPAPSGVTGIALYAYGSDNTVEFDADVANVVIQELA
jgi:hypothetical protein